jgi:hypothetical protein
MNRGMYALFLVAAVSATLVAGCGGGSGNSTSSSTTASSATTSTTTTTAKTSSTTTTVTAPQAGSGGAALAAYCQSSLAAAKARLSASEASEFESYCGSLAHDNAAQIKSAEQKLCTEIIKDTVPAADRALANAECAKL